MVGVDFVHFLFLLLLAGAMIRVFELKFKDSDNALGSTARALAVIY